MDAQWQLSLAGPVAPASRALVTPALSNPHPGMPRSAGRWRCQEQNPASSGSGLGLRQGHFIPEIPKEKVCRGLNHSEGEPGYGVGTANPLGLVPSDGLGEVTDHPELKLLLWETGSQRCREPGMYFLVPPTPGSCQRGGNGSSERGRKMLGVTERPR